MAGRRLVTGQMGLALSLRDDCRFDTFLTLPGSRQQIVDFIYQQFSAERERFVYLWGVEGSGRSHLLQAACHHWASNNRKVQYLPLADLRTLPPEQVMAGLENVDLVCIDEVNLIADQQNWLEVLFHFFNRSRDSGTCLLASADVPPVRLALGLADLQSRLSTATVFQMDTYIDTDKISILQFRANCLGLQLSDEAAGLLLNRAPRQLDSLIERLRELDRSSLIHQRKLTVPFIKKVFDW